jgi:6-hydroxynicotinate 3-monooxygenase
MYLQRFGFDVRVYEQAERLERIGAGIGLTPNATHICRDVGLLERMERAGSLPRERYSRDGFTGEVTLEVPIDQFAAKYGGPHIVMRRGDLHDIFASGVAPENLFLGKRLVDLVDGPSSVRLAFADGSSAEADLVIGADGINSRVRERAIGGPPAYFSGEVAHRAIYPRERLGDMPIAEMTKWFSGSDRYVMVFFLTPERDDVYFVTGYPQAQWDAPTYAPVTTDREQLRSGFADYCPDVRRLLEAAPEVTTWPICERDPAPGWSRGRIVLLGDACHPMRPHMGQGAAMAIEDAVVLARCIDFEEGLDPTAMFERYERLRFDRTSKIQLGSRGNTWMRDGMDIDWLYGYDPMTVPL